MTKKIMVCDDDQAIIEMMEIVLESPDREILTEIDSLKLLHRLVNEKPDLLIIDLWMPKLSGDEVIKKIRNDYNIHSIPIIVISASRDGVQVAKLAGADQYISKPFDINELEQKINTLLQA